MRRTMTFSALTKTMPRKRPSVVQHTEIHSMGNLFVPEIEFIAAQSESEVFETRGWLAGMPLHEHSWSGYVAARATAIRS
jgi:hypothetical protein